MKMETSGRENLSPEASAAMRMLERIRLLHHSMLQHELEAYLKEVEDHVVNLDNERAQLAEDYKCEHMKLLEQNMQERP